MTETHRIVEARDLGRARRGIDLALGIGAVLPLVLAGAATFTADAQGLALLRVAAVIWAACLLCFFAGVRRGLTFSEAGGGRSAEIVTMLALFAAGVATMLFRSPALGALGCAAVGGLDAVAGRRGEAPRYFTAFRPVQMAVCTVALLVVALRTV